MPITSSGARFEREVGDHIETVFPNVQRFQRRKDGDYLLQEVDESGDFNQLKSASPNQITLVREEVYRTRRSRQYSRARDKRVDWRLVFPDGSDFMIECKHQSVSGSVDEKLWEGIPNRLADRDYWADYFMLFVSGKHVDQEAVNILQEIYEEKADRQVLVTKDWQSKINQLSNLYGQAR